MKKELQNLTVKQARDKLSELKDDLRELQALLNEEPEQENETMYDGYYIVRTYSAGVFAGEIAYRKDKEVKMLNARRLWYWDGAASLSQLAMEGTSSPRDCKFPAEVNEVILAEAIEIIKCTEKARKSIKNVKVWQQ